MGGRIVKSKYVDCNGWQINYGDILKFPPLEKEPRQKYEPKRPFGMLVKLDGEDMIYLSGLCEYHEVSAFRKEEEPINMLGAVEIFAPRSEVEQLFKECV